MPTLISMSQKDYLRYRYGQYIYFLCIHILLKYNKHDDCFAKLQKTCQSSIELHDNYEKLWKRKIEIFPAPEMKE